MTPETLQALTTSGRSFSVKQLEQIRDTVQTFQNLSRKELANTICEHLNWRNPMGGLKVDSCLVALEKFASLGIITLQPKKTCRRSAKTTKAKTTELLTSMTPLTEPLANLVPIELRRVTTKAERDLWQDYIDRFHYLGYKRPFGAHIRYFIVSKAKNDQILGCLLFSAAAWALAPRDFWIGWKRKDRAKRLNLIVNNSRFLILPWIQVEHLASKALALAATTVTNDWKKVYGYQPVLLETFVDTTKYSGTCYIAANWQKLGTTQGRGRMDRFERKEVSAKTIFAYPLTADFRDRLRGKCKPKKPSSAHTALSEQASESPHWIKVQAVLTEICSEFDKKWQKRRRVIDTLMLVLLIFRLVLSKNSQSYATTLQDTWKNRRDLQLTLPQPKPIAPSSLTQARKKLGEDVFKTMNKKLISIYENEDHESSWFGRRIFAVDGSKINLPRSLTEADYTVPSSGHYPQGLVSTLYQLKSKLPYDFDLVNHGNERTCATVHLDSLKQRDVVVYDRGYFSYSMLYSHKKRGIDAIFRLSEQSCNEIKAFIKSDEVDKTVTVVPSCKKKQRKLKQELHLEKLEQLTIRLIKYTHQDTTYYLGTTLLDRKQFPAAIFSDAYHARWGIEELYKISKVLIDIEDFHSQSERGIKQELYAHFVLITLSRLLANQAETILNGTSSSKGVKKAINTDLSSFHRSIKVNFKNCLGVVSRYIDEFILVPTSRIVSTINEMLLSIGNVKQTFRTNRSYKRKSMKPKNKWHGSTKQKAIPPIAATAEI